MVKNNSTYLILLYDNTFDGLLSAIFDVYRLKLSTFDIVPTTQSNQSLFKPTLTISTNKAKANRIKIGLKNKIKQDMLPFLAQTFHQSADKEKDIYQFIKKAFDLPID